MTILSAMLTVGSRAPDMAYVSSPRRYLRSPENDYNLKLERSAHTDIIEATIPRDNIKNPLHTVIQVTLAVPDHADSCQQNQYQQ